MYGFQWIYAILKYFVGWDDWDLKDPDHPQALVELTFSCIQRFVPRTAFSPWEFLLILNHSGVLKLSLCCAYVATFLGGWNNKATGLEIRFSPLCCWCSSCSIGISPLHGLVISLKLYGNWFRQEQRGEGMAVMIQISVSSSVRVWGAWKCTSCGIRRATWG